MLGYIVSALAGVLMSVQGVLNTGLSKRLGTMYSNAFVQGTAFLLSLAALLFVNESGFGAIQGTPLPYLLGGAAGLFITVTVMLGMGSLGPAAAVSVILVSQLLSAAVIEAFGWLGAEKTQFGWNKFVGIAVMLAGIWLFKRK